MSEELVHRAFAVQARRTPGRTAVAHAGRSLTYAELDAGSARLARLLRARGVGPESRVGLCLERGAESIVAVLGILRAGGAYVPLDPTWPAERLARVAAGSGLVALVSRPGLRERVPVPRERVVCLDGDRAALEAEPPEAPDARVGPDGLAYVIHTSGSTGAPKGVMVSHRAVLDLSAALEDEVYRGLGGPLRVSLNAPLVFDGSVKQWIQLLRGHALHVVPERERTEPARMLAWLRDSGVEVLDCTPTVLRALLAAGLGEPGSHAPSLVLSGGEALDAADWAALRALPATRVCNLYGPAEFTVDATAAWIDGSASPTIGRPLAGTALRLLDPAGDPVPDGEEGEVALAGTRLARGYLGRADLTAERFVPDPFAGAPGARLYLTGDLARSLPCGCLEYRGRADDQVQIRGARVEPGEVAAVLREHPAVRDAAVVARPDARGGTRLAAYVVPRQGARGPADALRGWLRARLPEHMVPSAWAVLDALPTTRNGKLDRGALPAPGEDGAGREWVPPRTPTEEVLAAAWREVLGTERVGAGDNFFDLGGDSLLLVRLHERLAGGAGAGLSVPDLFQLRTLAEMARRVDQLRDGPGEAARDVMDRADARRARTAVQRTARASGVRTNFRGTDDEQRG